MQKSLGCALYVRCALSVGKYGIHSHKTRHKIIVFYILIYVFLDNRWEGRRSRTEWYHEIPEFYLLLTPFLIQFWFVIVMFKFLNLVTFCGFITILSNTLVMWFDITHSVNLLLNKSLYWNLIIVSAFSSHSCFHPKMTGVNTDQKLMCPIQLQPLLV
jgi:hypothetical protein